MELYSDVLCSAGHEVDGFAARLFTFSRELWSVRCRDLGCKDARNVRNSTCKETKGIRNDVQAFLMSAFEITEEHNSDLKEIELKEFLQKPFHMQQLVTMIDKHMGQKAITNPPRIGSGIN